MKYVLIMFLFAALFAIAGCGVSVSKSEINKRIGIIPDVVLEDVEGTPDHGIYLTFSHVDLGPVVVGIGDVESLTDSDFSIGEISGFRPLVISCGSEGEFAWSQYFGAESKVFSDLHSENLSLKGALSRITEFADMMEIVPVCPEYSIDVSDNWESRYCKTYSDSVVDLSFVKSIYDCG